MLRATRSTRTSARSERPSPSTARSSRPRASRARPRAGESGSAGKLRVRRERRAPAGARARRRRARARRWSDRAGPRALELAPGDGRDGDAQVDAVEHRSGEARAVALDQRVVAGAVAQRIAAPAARTWIHRGDELEARGKLQHSLRARDAHGALLERLAQRLERGARELDQLVEEEHARGARARSRRDGSADRRRSARQWRCSGAARAAAAA